MSDLPIFEVLPELLSTLQQHTRVVLEAPPGAGKTTAVPPAMLAAPWLAGQKILMLEPRRIAARSAAQFMAYARGEAVGHTIGYRIRFEARVSAATRIEIVTEGILTRMLQDDPLLDGVGALIFDEFHERHLQGDLALALALDAQQSVRADLRILLMSATLDGERLAAWLGAARVRSAGRAYPVELRHVPPRRDEALELHMSRAVRELLPESCGAVLCFLPGKREIERTQNLLEAALEAPPGVRYEVLPLHGELPIDAQARAIEAAPEGVRRIILSTNVAESSLTVPDVRAVIDSGLAREPRFDPVSGFSRLVTARISLSSATQRAGRAGRLAPGVALRLWTTDTRLEAQVRAELLNVELSSFALELAAWGSAELRFLDTPPPGVMAQARELLRDLGALDEQDVITGHGRRLLKLGTHPRLANLVERTQSSQQRALAAVILALLDQRDVLRGLEAREVDWSPRVRLALSQPSGVLRHALEQWRRRIRAEGQPSLPSAHAIGDLLLHAYPDRVGKLSAGTRYQLANGRGAVLPDDSSLRGSPWLVVTDLDGEGADARIRRAAVLDLAALQHAFPERFERRRMSRFDPASGGVISSLQQRFGRIVLEDKPLPANADAQTLQALLDGVRQLGLQALPWTEGSLEFRNRARCVRDWLPEAGLPDLTDAALLAGLDNWLAPYLQGRTRLGQLDGAALDQALRSHFDHRQLGLIDTSAPRQLSVPSGMPRKIDYTPGSPPVLAVKLQELFGLADTPTVAQGRVPVLLHLLSPGGRPVQMTSDLRGFWDRTYPEVRKELKGRYPRHPWPDDPWSAKATHRAKPRGT
jgi:ATP-dependent helicase HrpB